MIIRTNKRPFERIAIVGTGGFAREVFCLLLDIDERYGRIRDSIVFVEKEDALLRDEIMGRKIVPVSGASCSEYKFAVAVAEPAVRKRIVETELADATFATIRHPNAVLSQYCTIKAGAIITAGVILTCNISIGTHAHLNLHTTIGHDCRIGDYFTTAPGANISGNCDIGNKVYVGSNASIKQGIAICDDTVIGMGSAIVKNITEAGTYIGCPAKPLMRSTIVH